MKTLRVALLVVFAALSLSADQRTYTITEDGKNYMTFESAATLETIKGTTTKVNGVITADPQNIAASMTAITVDLTAIDTGIGMRNDHLRDRFLDTPKFPAATFKSVSVSSGQKGAAPNKPEMVRITGDLTLHGVTRRITVPVRVVYIPESELTRTSRGPGDWIHATATFPIKLADHAISVPDRMIMKIAGSVDVTLDVFAVARPEKKAE